MSPKRMWLVALSLGLLASAGCCRACHRFCPEAPAAYAPAPPAPQGAYYVPCVPCCPTTAGAAPAPVPAVPPSQTWNPQVRPPVVCCPCN